MAEVHKLIKSRREELGWTDTQMARRVGLSVSEYFDIELHADELATVTPLMNVRRLAEAIDTPVHRLFGIDMLDGAFERCDRHERIARARARLGVTTQELAEQIGFTERFVAFLEAHENCLEIYPYAVLELVANALKIPPPSLL